MSLSSHCEVSALPFIILICCCISVQMNCVIFNWKLHARASRKPREAQSSFVYAVLQCAGMPQSKTTGQVPLTQPSSSENASRVNGVCLLHSCTAQRQLLILLAQTALINSALFAKGWEPQGRQRKAARPKKKRGGGCVISRLRVLSCPLGSPCVLSLMPGMTAEPVSFVCADTQSAFFLTSQHVLNQHTLTHPTRNLPALCPSFTPNRPILTPLTLLELCCRAGSRLQCVQVYVCECVRVCVWERLCDWMSKCKRQGAP